ncbi:unnamed protein product [Orchesella dallaii]|uniref:Odorant receptor n=1 Tax=Orchesella dallaii TaxID=48710 RepID=A0ABP1R8I3_9HEXA
MLTTSQVLKGFKLHLIQRHLTSNSPFTLNHHNFGDPMLKACSNTKIRRHWLKMGLSCLFVSVLWLQLFQGRKKELLVTKLESTLYVFGISGFIIMNATHIKRNELVVQLFNCLYNFEKGNLDGRVVEKRDKLLVNFVQFNGFMGSPLLVGSYSLQRWLNPCTSATFAMNVLQECSNPNDQELHGKWSTKSSIYLALIVWVSLWLVGDLVGAFTFQVSEVAFLQTCCFVSYIKQLGKALTLQSSEPHNLLLNSYVLACMGTQISIPHLILFSSALFDGICTDILCFGAFASVHSESSRLVAYMKGQLLPNLEGHSKNKPFSQKHKLKLIKKLVTSFYPIKVRIGAVNFVEKFTPIIMLNFCVAQIVNLLLID